jgi:CheY-like chemotaxis protein
VLSQKNCLDSSQSLLGIRVFLVEDEPDIVDLLMFILETAGAKVLVFRYAEVALKRLELLCPDILLCNLRLPLEDGCWLIQQIRTHSCVAFRQLPAIALTSYTRDVSEQKALDAGFDQFLVKFENSIVDEIIHLLSIDCK